MEVIVAMIISIATVVGIPPNFALAIAYAEHWNGSIADTDIREDRVSRANWDGSRDVGVMQLNNNYFDHLISLDAEQNITAGCRHIRWLASLREIQTWWVVALCYNAGASWLMNGLAPPASSLHYADLVMQIFYELDGIRGVPIIRYDARIRRYY